MSENDVPEFEWDAANLGHIARHGVAAGEVEAALCNDPLDLSYEQVGNEDRWTILGHSERIRVLLVVFTIRGGLYRVVTARDASKRIRREYLAVKGFAL